MLNIIWSGLIIVGIIIALIHDISDEIYNTYHNGETYQFNYTIKNAQFIELYSDQLSLTAERYSAQNFQQLRLSSKQTLPDLWQQISQLQISKDKEQLLLKIIEHNPNNRTLKVQLPEVHWVKMRAITQAAFDMAEFAIKLAIGLVGIMSLWLGLMKVAEASGLILIFVKLIRPLLSWLFPDIPKNHPALGSISLNLAANVLGLGNAATPMGIKAMQQLQDLNKQKDQASDAMCMFLALNTSSVQLLPPVTLIAIMGTQVGELIIPIILATSASTITAVTMAKFFARRSRKCNTAA